MRYTVNQLAKLSGVTARTLRFYDEIGLLKPAYYGENQYRYYQEEQLLMLQQILFFRELDFPLSDIQRILSSDDFDKVEALLTHKSVLQANLEKAQTLIKTIDKTISYLRGKLLMRDAEMYEGFDPAKQTEYESYMVDRGILNQQQISESWEVARNWKKSDWTQFQNESDAISKQLVDALTRQLKPDSQEVQELIRQHHHWVKTFWTPTRESYIGLAQLYLDHPDFRGFYDDYHPKLLAYLVEGMKIFAQRELT